MQSRIEVTAPEQEIVPAYDVLSNIVKEIIKLILANKFEIYQEQQTLCLMDPNLVKLVEKLNDSHLIEWQEAAGILTCWKLTLIDNKNTGKLTIHTKGALFILIMKGLSQALSQIEVKHQNYDHLVAECKNLNTPPEKFLALLQTRLYKVLNQQPRSIDENSPIVSFTFPENEIKWYATILRMESFKEWRNKVGVDCDVQTQKLNLNKEGEFYSQLTAKTKLIVTPSTYQSSTAIPPLAVQGMSTQIKQLKEKFYEPDLTDIENLIKILASLVLQNSYKINKETNLVSFINAALASYSKLLSDPKHSLWLENAGIVKYFVQAEAGGFIIELGSPLYALLAQIVYNHLTQGEGKEKYKLISKHRDFLVDFLRLEKPSEKFMKTFCMDLIMARAEGFYKEESEHIKFRLRKNEFNWYASILSLVKFSKWRIENVKLACDVLNQEILIIKGSQLEIHLSAKYIEIMQQYPLEDKKVPAKENQQSNKRKRTDHSDVVDLTGDEEQQIVPLKIQKSNPNTPTTTTFFNSSNRADTDLISQILQDSIVAHAHNTEHKNPSSKEGNPLYTTIPLSSPDYMKQIKDFIDQQNYEAKKLGIRRYILKENTLYLELETTIYDTIKQQSLNFIPPKSL